MNFRPVLEKELRSYFGSLMAYLILMVSLLMAGYFFYTDTLYFNLFNMGNTSLSEGLWQYFFHDLRFVLLMVIPLLTMRLFAEEKKLGTIELIATYPLRDIEILLGKLFACLTVFLLILLFTLLYPLMLSGIWDVEIAPLLSGYLGIFLIGFGFISLGIFVSSVTESHILAAIITYGLLILFWFLTWNEAVAEPWLIEILLRLSLFDHFYNFGRNIIETKDIIFFLLFASLFLFLTLKALSSRRWRGMK